MTQTGRKLHNFITLVAAVVLVLVAVLPSSVLGTPSPSLNPTKNPTTRSPTAPTSAPTIGCSAADETLWKTKYYFTFSSVMNTCGTASVGDYAKALTCFQDDGTKTSRSKKGFPEFSKSCIECHVTLVQCTKDSCITDCLKGGEENEKCRTCVESNCNAAYTACTGWLPGSCSDCVQASETIIPGIPDEGAYGIFAAAGVVAIIGFSLLICCLRRQGSGGNGASVDPSSEKSGGGSNLGTQKPNPYTAPAMSQSNMMMQNTPGMMLASPQQMYAQPMMQQQQPMMMMNYQNLTPYQQQVLMQQQQQQQQQQLAYNSYPSMGQ